MNVLRFFNRQKTRALNLPALQKITLCLLQELLPEVLTHELGIHLVGAKEMAQVNMDFLQHEGSTDVITFDYGEGAKSRSVTGELYICLDDALVQAKEFRTTWTSELTRYIVHGVLHLRGYDDLKPAARRIMKREENRLLKKLSQRFPLGKLERVKNGRKRK